MCKCFIIPILLCVVGIMQPAVALPLPASLKVNPAQVPLVIVRFNQRAVYFERQLYNAIERAVDAKPSVKFEVVSYVPVTGNHARDSRAMNVASANRNKVLKSMEEIGIPRRRIGLHIEPDSRLKFDEVHIFVQ